MTVIGAVGYFSVQLFQLRSQVTSTVNHLNLRNILGHQVSCTQTRSTIGSCSSGQKIRLIDIKGNQLTSSSTPYTKINGVQLYAKCKDDTEVEIFYLDDDNGWKSLYDPKNIGFHCEF